MGEPGRGPRVERGSLRRGWAPSKPLRATGDPAALGLCKDQGSSLGSGRPAGFDGPPRTMLQLQDLTRRFGAQVALDRVSLCLAPGDCYGFIGHNGAGKTTAMRIALGLAAARRGHGPRRRLRRAPRSARGARAHGRADRGAGLPRPARAARRTWRCSRGCRAWRAPRRAARPCACSSCVGLAHAVGESRCRPTRRACASASASRRRCSAGPRYVLLDEPTNGLDPEGIAEVRALLRRLAQDEGTTVLVSSHQLHELAGLCNRIGVLQQGACSSRRRRACCSRRLGQRHELARRRRARAPCCARLGIAAERRASDGGALARARRRRAPGVARARWSRRGARRSRASDRGRRRSRRSTCATRTADEGGAAGPRRRAAPPRRGGGRGAGSARRAAARRRAHAALRARALAGARRTLPLLLAPAALGVLAMLRRARAGRRAHRARSRPASCFSTTDVTAFEAVGVALARRPAVLALLARAREPVDRGRARARDAAQRAAASAEPLASRGRQGAGGAGHAARLLRGPGGDGLAAASLCSSSATWPRSCPTASASRCPFCRQRALARPAGRPARAAACRLAACALSASPRAPRRAGRPARWPWRSGRLLALDLARAPARGFGVETCCPPRTCPRRSATVPSSRSIATSPRGSATRPSSSPRPPSARRVAWCLGAFLASVLLLSRRDVP